MSTHTEPLPSVDNPEETTASENHEEKKGLFLRMFDTRAKKIGWAVAGAATGAAITIGALLPKNGGDFTNPDVDGQPGIEVTSFPNPDDPDYDPFLKIGNKSSITIYDIDWLANFFTVPEVSRETLITALSQANQEEVELILQVMNDFDSSNNTAVTEVLNKYGLTTNEVPIDPMGRISELNDLTETELNSVLARYADIPYNDIKDSLEQFSQEETDATRKVLNGLESPTTLDNLLRKYGAELGDNYTG